MAWNAITGSSIWEYSNDPATDDPYNTDIYTGKHTAGIRTNSDGTENYVYCRKNDRANGKGYGELNKTHIDGSGGSSSWILSSGFWNDSGLWDDTATWID